MPKYLKKENKVRTKNMFTELLIRFFTQFIDCMFFIYCFFGAN